MRARPLIQLAIGLAVAALAPGARAQDPSTQSAAASSAAGRSFALRADGLAAAASNPDQALAVAVDTTGLTVETSGSTSKALSARFAAVGFGRVDSVKGLPSGSLELSSALDQILLDRSSLLEWVINAPEGVEHGFTIPSDPAGTGALRIVITLSGDLYPSLSNDRSGILLRDAGGIVQMTYGQLAAYDVKRNPLKAWFSLTGNSITIECDDASATYPITVDPLITANVVKINGSDLDGLMGHAVAICGDLTADPPPVKRDLIVGVPGANLDGDVLTGEGKVLIYKGTGTGLASTPFATIQLAAGIRAGARFGQSVACGGDLDGDGDDDVIIGAPNFSNGQIEEGAVFVVFGPIAGNITIQNPPANSTYSAPFEVDQAGAHFGASVAGPGNLGGGLEDDVLVGAPDWIEGSNSSAGRVLVFFGGLGPGGLDRAVDWTQIGTQKGERLGHVVAGAEDFDADGNPDVLASAPGWDGTNGADEGRIDLFKGPIGSTSAQSVYSGVPGAALGISLAAVGDVNGDGFADFAAGAPFYTGDLPAEGEIIVCHGKSSGGPAATTLIEGDVRYSLFGESIAAAGDVNADSLADLAVGSRFSVYDTSAYRQYEGRVSVFQGTMATDCGHAPGGIPPTPVQVLTPGLSFPESTNFAGTIATANDLNNDGASELIIAAERMDLPDTTNPANRDKGRLYVFRGTTGSVPLSPTQTLADTSGGSAALFGSAVANAGDLNGDGLRDLVVGAPVYTISGAERGRIEVYYGTSTGYSSTPQWTYSCNVAGVCNQTGSKFGQAVAAAGDVNGDGYADLIAAAPEYSTGAGAAFVFYGSACGLYDATSCPTANPTPWIVTGTAGAKFGFSVATAGDPNADGCSDVIVGAYNDNTGTSSFGKAFLYLGCLGSGGLLQTAPDWTGSSSVSGGRYGWVVGSAGDVNLDGWGDVFVGVPYATQTLPEEGRVNVYHGRGPGQSPSLPASPDWSERSGEAGAHYGWSVSSADLDSNGASDLIIGAPDFGPVDSGEGNVHVYLGAETAGLAHTEPSNWPVESNRTGAHFGKFVAGIADVSGDGISDILIGSPDDPPSVKIGRVSVHIGSGSGPASTSFWNYEWAETEGTNINFGAAGAAGDSDGDSFRDLFIGAPGANRVVSFEVNPPCVVCICNPHLKKSSLPRQIATNSKPIVVGTNNKPPSTPADTFKIRLNAMSPAGRTKIVLEWEVKPLGTPFSLEQTTRSGPIDTGAVASGQSMYSFEQHITTTPGPRKWRVRVLSTRPQFPDSRWYTLTDNGPEEADLRVTP